MIHKTMGIDELRAEIRRKYAILQNWRTVAKGYKITAAVAYRIANSDYEPRTPHLRAMLNLPALIPAPACPRCGQVHVTRRCTVNDKPSTKPRWVRVPGHAGGEWQ